MANTLTGMLPLFIYFSHFYFPKFEYKICENGIVRDKKGNYVLGRLPW